MFGDSVPNIFFYVAWLIIALPIGIIVAVATWVLSKTLKRNK